MALYVAVLCSIFVIIQATPIPSPPAERASSEALNPLSNASPADNANDSFEGSITSNGGAGLIENDLSPAERIYSQVLDDCEYTDECSTSGNLDDVSKDGDEMRELLRRAVETILRIVWWAHIKAHGPQSETNNANHL